MPLLVANTSSPVVLQLPLLQRIGDEAAEWNRAFAVLRLRRADLLITVGTLPDVQLVLLKVDILPAEAAQLGRTQASEGGDHK